MTILKYYTIKKYNNNTFLYYKIYKKIKMFILYPVLIIINNNNSKVFIYIYILSFILLIIG